MIKDKCVVKLEITEVKISVKKSTPVNKLNLTTVQKPKIGSLQNSMKQGGLQSLKSKLINGP